MEPTDTEELKRIDSIAAFEGCLYFLIVCVLALGAILLLTWFARSS
jgi:hypothetical protein